MGNIVDYIDWRGDLTFAQDPFNEVDSLILTEIVYIGWKHCLPMRDKEKTLAEVGQEYFEKNPAASVRVGVFFDKKMGIFAEKVCLSKRFGCISVVRHFHQVGKDSLRQFSATTFRIAENTYYISFQGTDDSLIGWAEDLGTLAYYPVNAQKKAAAYAKKEMMLHPEGKFLFGGHSKGGNLAVYAAYSLTKAEREKLLLVYSNDGQGFTPGQFEREKFDKVAEKVVQIVPEDCLVGNLLEEYPCRRVVVKPLCSGILEHDGLKWSVMGNSFERVESVSQKSLATKEGIQKLIAGLSQEEKESLVSELLALVNSVGAETLTDLKKEKFLIPRIAKAFSPRNSRLFLSLVQICVTNGMVF